MIVAVNTNAAKPARQTKPSGPRSHVLTSVLFGIYVVLLIWIILWKLAVPWIGEAALLPHPIKLIPFLPTAEDGGSAPLEVLFNVLLFIPYGLYLGLLAPSLQWWKAAGVFAGSSLILETAQPLLSIGSFDTTDVLVNTAGGLAGLGLLTLARRRLRTRTDVVMTKALGIGTALSLIAVTIFIASPLRYAPQHDVIVEQTGRDHTR